MKKLLSILTVLLFSSCLIACQENTTDITTQPTTENQSKTFTGTPLYDGEILVSQVITNQDEVTYLEVEGNPFLYIGTQIRTDAFMNTDNYDYEDLEPLFSKAKELGVTSLQIPIEWKDIELKEDVFDYTYIDKMLTFANKYNIKIEFLWFGTNMVGDTHSYTVPDYIIRDGKTYPKFDAIRTGEYWNYYGILWRLDFNDPDLMEREANALSRMMEYVYNWDRYNEAKHPLIGVQILNEADAFFRWRQEQYQVLNLDGSLMTLEEGMKKVLDSLNYLGMTVKNSLYKVYTRTNFANSVGGDSFGVGNGIYSGNDVKTPPFWAKDIYNLEGIDVVGDDSYKSNIVDIKGIVNMYTEKLPGNFGQISENDGSYSNTPSLILTAVQGEGGYSIYDFCTSPFFIRNGSSGVDQGITYLDENNILKEREHFSNTQKLIDGLKKVGPLAVTSKRENFIAFNLEDNNPVLNINQTIQTEHVIASFSTNNKAIGFLISTENYIYCWASNDASISFSNVELGSIETGYFNSSNQFVLETSISLNQGILEMTGYTMYRVQIKNINQVLQSNTWDYVG